MLLAYINHTPQTCHAPNQKGLRKAFPVWNGKKNARVQGLEHLPCIWQTPVQSSHHYRVPEPHQK